MNSGDASNGSNRRADAVRNRASVLAAAEGVFDRIGPTASTAEIARVAGVGVGTVFRHFPTKQELLVAIMKDRLARVGAEAEALIAGDDPDAFFTFFASLVDQAAGKKSVVEALAREGIDLSADRPVGTLAGQVEPLLHRAREHGRIRLDAEMSEVMALLTGICQAAVAAGWDSAVRNRVLVIVFDGLRPRP